ncbi:MFS transporter, partial [Chloroflexota bacterium]
MEVVQVVDTAVGAIAKGLDFLRRQQRDWKVTVVRSNSAMFLYRLVFPYLSIYIVALGATATQLGVVNSVGMVVAGLVSPFTGALIDRVGAKRIYLIAIFLLAMSYLTYGVAQSWTIIMIAMTAYWIGQSVSMQNCSVICANSLANKERATGMAICETAGMGALAMVAPILGALLVTAFGGINVSGIRPIFFICMAGTIATLLLILTQLSNRRWGTPAETSPNFFKGISQVFREGKNLKRWLVIFSVTSLPMGMVMPFRYVFANEIKGADQFVLGAMVTASGLMPMVLGIFVGRLADKVGRKKVMYLSMPFVWASNLLLIFAPNPAFLILAGAFQGFFMLSGLPSRAMARELVPPEQMGRWLGISRFCSMLFSAGSVYLAGVIWDNIGPEYVFLTIIATDILIRIPLLIGMPETLGSRND